MAQTADTADTTDTSDRPPVVSLLNAKGGVGKTTLTVQLAGALADRGHDVLVIDLAPEGALTSIVGHDDAYQPTADATLHDVLLAPSEHADTVADLRREAPEFDLLPSNEAMVDATADDLKGEPKSRERLDMLLEAADVVDEYDVILVDNAPAINALTDNALVSSDGVFVPLYPEVLSVNGIDRVEKQIASVDEYFGEVNVLAFVLNRIENNGQADAMTDAVHDSFGDTFRVAEIRKRVVLQRSIAQSQASIFGHPESCDMSEVLDELAAVVETDLDLETAEVKA